MVCKHVQTAQKHEVSLASGFAEIRVGENVYLR